MCIWTFKVFTYVLSNESIIITVYQSITYYLPTITPSTLFNSNKNTIFRLFTNFLVVLISERQNYYPPVLLTTPLIGLAITNFKSAYTWFAILANIGIKKYHRIKYQQDYAPFENIRPDLFGPPPNLAYISSIYFNLFWFESFRLSMWIVRLIFFYDEEYICKNIIAKIGCYIGIGKLPRLSFFH